MTNFFENLFNRYNEALTEEARNQIRLKYKEAIEKAKNQNKQEIFNDLCNKYQNLLYLADNKDFNDIIVDSFALLIRINIDKKNK